MRIVDCKVVEAAKGKVVVTFFGPGSFTTWYQVTVKIIGDESYDETAKGEYNLMKILFESYNAIAADVILTSCFNRSKNGTS